MVKIEHVITGNSINAIIEVALSRIKLQHKDFFKEQLKESLSNKGQDTIDGNFTNTGTSYSVVYSKPEKVFKVIENYFHIVEDKLVFEKQKVQQLFADNLEVYFFSKGMFDSFMDQEKFDKANIGDYIELSTKNSLETYQLNMVFVRIQ